MSVSIDLSKKVAVVTGGTRGIGRAVARAMGRAGASVAVLGRSEPLLSEVAGELHSIGVSCSSHAVDVTDGERVRSTFASIVEEMGKIDILVNNAGITRDNILLRMKPEEWNDVLSTNLTGVFLCTQAVARFMLKARSGKIINLTSVSGIRGHVGQANYTASKAGVIALTKTTAKEFAARGIQVNAVAPGLIETDMMAEVTDETRDFLMANLPAGRLGTPDEVSSAVLFLASPHADYITGHVLVVDGGLAM